MGVMIYDKEYIRDTIVPIDFLDSHSIGHYGWIFERTPIQKGYVTPK